MYVIQVIPLAKGVKDDTLSYFSSHAPTLGSLVKIPLRNRTVWGIAIDCVSASEVKADIKKADFALRKIKTFVSSAFLSTRELDMARLYAERFATGLSDTIKALYPNILIEARSKIYGALDFTPAPLPPHETHNDRGVIQASIDERVTHYKSLVRTEFASKRSVHIIVPSVYEAEYLGAELGRGVAERVFVLDSSQSTVTLKKKITACLQKDKAPLLVISTPSFVALMPPNLSTLIFESEQSSLYKGRSRPYFDPRIYGEIVSRHTGILVIYADIVNRLYTLAALKRGEAREILVKWRVTSTAECELVSMASSESGNKNSFKIMSNRAVELLEAARKGSSHVLVIAVRRGLSGTVICGDCGSTVKCLECDAPVSLHQRPVKNQSKDPRKADVENIFLCHKCGGHRDAAEVCKVCGSWKLAGYGVAVDLVADRIRANTKSKVYTLSHDSADTRDKAQKIVREFLSHPGSVLVATPMSLLYIREPISTVIIASIDALFGLPDPHVSERIMWLVSQLKSLATEHLLIHTRLEHPLLATALSGHISQFLSDELPERERFALPPYTVVIRISVSGAREAIVKTMSDIVQAVAPREADVFPTFGKTSTQALTVSATIRVPHTQWPDARMVSYLRSLPPWISVDVYPQGV